MDAIDSQILRALLSNGRASVTELSEAVGKSHSATRQRLHKLSTDGTIDKFTIDINPEILGLAVDAVVDIKSPGNWPIGKFDEALLNCPEIVDAIYLTGDFDYQIRINCKSAEDLNTILHSLRTELELEEINVRVALGIVPGFPRRLEPDSEEVDLYPPFVANEEVEEEEVEEEEVEAEEVEEEDEEPVVVTRVQRRFDIQRAQF